jgi:nucleoside-diphosphate-sugar epimerase
VDYDVTGDGEGLMPLFGAQVDVRNILRARAEASNVKWTVISTGVFMSFLFEDWWGVVQRHQDGKVTVRALRSWEHKVTVTDVNDIAKVLGPVIAGKVEAENRVLYAAGDTVSYGQLAEIVERVTGRKVEREEWSIAHLKEELAKDPDDAIKRYRLVFARDGVWWNKEGSVNYRLGIACTDVESYAKRILAGFRLQRE